MDSNSQTLLIVFVALTGLAVLLQACVLLGIFIAMRKATKLASDAAGDIRATVIPLIHSTRETMERITPQIVTISTGLAELTELVHKETSGVRFSVAEIADRVSRQVARADGMLTVGLDTVERAASALEHSVAAPVRQANGILAAVKAMVHTYRSTPPPSQRATYPDPDRDLVI